MEATMNARSTSVFTVSLHCHSRLNSRGAFTCRYVSFYSCGLTQDFSMQSASVYFSGFSIWQGVSQLMGSNYFFPIFYFK